MVMRNNKKQKATPAIGFMRRNQKISFFSLLMALILMLSLAGCGQISSSMAANIQSRTESSSAVSTTLPAMDESGRFTAPEDVAAYLHTYKHLPSNFIIKQKAMDLGWESELGNLWDVTDECSIGGDVFGNREGLLPKKTGRIWYECDVNYDGGFRGAERVVYSSDGLIYYTKDHYQTFSQLY